MIEPGSLMTRALLSVQTRASAIQTGQNCAQAKISLFSFNQLKSHQYLAQVLPLLLRWKIRCRSPGFQPIGQMIYPVSPGALTMNKTLLFLLSALLMAGVASAVIDDDDNIIGLYFDSDADSDCLEGVSSNSQVPCYIVLTRPTFSEVYGFELGFDYGSELIHLGTTFANSEAMDFGEPGNLVVGFGSPTYTNDATLLATLDMMYIDISDSPASLTLRGSSPSSLDPAYPSVLLTGGEIISTGLHAPTYAFQINGICSFDDTSASWTGVKSLYR